MDPILKEFLLDLQLKKSINNKENIFYYIVNRFNTNNKIKLKTSYQKKIFVNHKIVNKKYKKYIKILSTHLNKKNKTNF